MYEFSLNDNLFTFKDLEKKIINMRAMKHVML